MKAEKYPLDLTFESSQFQENSRGGRQSIERSQLLLISEEMGEAGSVKLPSVYLV